MVSLISAYICCAFALCVSKWHHYMAYKGLLDSRQHNTPQIFS